jgi:hypothetical protein
VDLELDTKEF